MAAFRSTLKLGELIAVRNRHEASQILLSAIRKALNPPPIKKPATTTISVLNKLTAHNYEKLAPGIISSMTPAAVDTILTFTVKQNEFSSLYIDLLAGGGLDLSSSVTKYLTDTVAQIDATNDTLVMPPDEEYDEFCTVVKRKKELMSRVKTLILIRDKLPGTGVDLVALKGRLAACLAQFTTNELGAEALMEALCLLKGVGTPAVYAQTCLDLKRRVSPKMRFKIETLMAR
jgi:hypothetical protein